MLAPRSTCSALFFVLGTMAAPLVFAQGPSHSGRFAIVNVSVVPMTSDTLLANQMVLVEDGRIASIAPDDSTRLPAGTATVDGSGAFLIPGLVDLHAHPTDESDFLLFLANGVTTVQYLNAFPEVLSWRDSVARGELLGPTLYACGGPISGVDDAASVVKVIADYESQGFDCIKIYDAIAKIAYDSLIAVAHARGFRVVGHIPRNLTWQDMLAAAPDAVAHAEEFLYSPIDSAEDLDTIVEGMKERRISLITTLTNYDLISRQPLELEELLARPELRYYSPVDQRVWKPPFNRYLEFGIEKVPNFRRLLSFQKRLVDRLHHADVPVLLGTDTGNVLVLPGWAVHDELNQLVTAGLTPYEALRAATVDAARFLGAADTFGTIAVGRRADLLLVAGNPTHDVANAGLILGVAAHGHWLARDTLRAKLGEQERSFAVETSFLERLSQDGLDAALVWLETQRRGSIGAALRWRALNELAYQLWYIEDNLPDAVRVFEANMQWHPDRWESFASLAEAYEAADRLHDAREAYRRALALNPAYSEGERKLETLREES